MADVDHDERQPRFQGLSTSLETRLNEWSIFWLQ